MRSLLRPLSLHESRHVKFKAKADLSSPASYRGKPYWQNLFPVVAFFKSTILAGCLKFCHIPSSGLLPRRDSRVSSIAKDGLLCAQKVRATPTPTTGFRMRGARSEYIAIPAFRSALRNPTSQARGLTPLSGLSRYLFGQAHISQWAGLSFPASKRYSKATAAASAEQRHRG